MRYYTLYKHLVRMLPSKGYGKDALSRMLARHRVRSGAVCLFDETGVTHTAVVGNAQKKVKATEDTFFRTASVSKMVCAMMALRLSEQGKLDLDADAAQYLGIPLRNPQYRNQVITPRMLLCHTSSLVDSDAFWQGAKTGKPLEQVLQGNVFSAHRPGTHFAYSNFGAGVLGAVLEGASHKSLDALLKEVFPFTEASFYPQNLPSDCVLADCGDILPPRVQYDAKALQRRRKAENRAEPLRHYAVGHGNLCIRAKDLAWIGIQAMTGFEKLREAQIPFGARDPYITEGLGMFIVNDAALCSNTVYGHQGLAYGAVNGVFFDPVQKKGFVLLTGGASVARKYVLADLNRDLIMHVLGGKAE